MKNAVILESADVKKIIAEAYGVSTDNVKSTGYSYYVELDYTEKIPKKEEFNK